MFPYNYSLLSMQNEVQSRYKLLIKPVLWIGNYIIGRQRMYSFWAINRNKPKSTDNIFINPDIALYWCDDLLAAIQITVSYK